LAAARGDAFSRGCALVHPHGKIDGVVDAHPHDWVHRQ
jgi:hypothetical protein